METVLLLPASGQENTTWSPFPHMLSGAALAKAANGMTPLDTMRKSDFKKRFMDDSIRGSKQEMWPERRQMESGAIGTFSINRDVKYLSW
jgi:hypothetical protein